MNTDEQRLSQLLKGTVPHPPHGLSADQVTARHVDRSAKSWALPALAAAAVAVIGVTAGVLASNHASGDAPASPGGAPAATASKPAATTSGSASPAATPTCQGDRTVPAVTGMTQAQAEAVTAQAGYLVKVTATTAPHVPPGTVVSQSPAAGTKMPAGGMVDLKVAAVDGTSTGTGTAPGPDSATQVAEASCPTVSASRPAQGAKTAVPNATGMSSAAATQVLEAAGFTVTVNVARAPAGQLVAPGTVYGQTPAAGSVASRGTGVTLHVAPVGQGS
jgi:beta-lactam-binding protein with PASTA domain